MGIDASDVRRGRAKFTFSGDLGGMLGDASTQSADEFMEKHAPASFIGQIARADARLRKTSGNPTPIPWFIPDWILLNEPTLLAGPGGIGKTILAMQLQAAGAVKNGKGKWLGMAVPTGPSLGLYSEDSMEAVENILDAAADVLETTVADLIAGDMHILPKPEGDLELVSFDRKGIPSLAPGWSDLKAAIDHYQPRLLVLDNLADFLPILPFDNGAIRRARHCALDPLCKAGLTILGLQNVTLQGLRATDENQGSSGGLAWRDAFRGRLLLRRPKDDEEKNRRELVQVKSNYSEEGNVIPLAWKRGLWAPETKGIIESIEQNAHERWLLGAVATLVRNRTPYSVHSNTESYLPKLLARLDGRPQRFGEKAIAGVFQRLLVNERIRIGEGKDKFRKPIDRVIHVEGHTVLGE